MAKEDIEKILEKHKEETKRHFDVVAERIEDKIGVVSEQVGTNTEKITDVQKKLEEHDQRFDKIETKLVSHDQRFDKIETKLVSHDQRFDKIEDTLEIIKLDIEFIKNELKQKVGRDEFAALEKRVSLLEAKLGPKQ